MSGEAHGMRAWLRQLQAGVGVRAQLARGALQGLAVTAVGVAVGFAVQVVLARLLGVNEFGIYSWALAWVNFLVLFACSGFEGLMSKRLPAYLIDRQFGRARGFLLFSALWVGGFALVLSLVVFAIAWMMQARLLPGVLATLALCILVTPLFALGSLRESILRAVKQVFRGQVLEAVVRPLLLAAFTVALVVAASAQADAVTAMVAQGLASFIVFVVGGFWVWRALPAPAREYAPQWQRKSWLVEALPFLAISGASAVSRQVGTLTLGAFGTAADTGIHAAIMRIAELVLMGSFSVAAIAAPLLVEVLKRNDTIGLTQILRWGARGASAFGCVAALVILWLGEWILAAFGKAFPAGEGALHVMLYGTVLGVFAGLSGVLLAMSGQAAVRAAIGWTSAACNLVLCLALVPAYGLHGAAWSFTLAMLVDSVLCLYYCWRRHRVWAGLG